jgi:putative membrane protein
MSRLMRTGAGAAVLALGLSGTAAASTGATTPQVVKREVVAAQLHSNGTLDVARLFSQLSVVGHGVVKVADPVSGKGLRNLDGFGTPTVKDGKALYTIHVDGTASRRTVSDFTKPLPVEVGAAYTLNGKPVSAKDIVGKTGDVTATYTITNVSGTPTTITWKDGKGVEQSDTIDLVTPYVGQVTTTLPGSFTGLVTPAADVAADGHGGTILTYSMVLFEPIGATTQTFTWKGHVRNGIIPPVTVQLVPASPTQKPELNTGVVGYRDGAAQAAQLTTGAGLIDANLLKLQSGAGDLLAGLTKLAKGARDLSDGLSAKIAPGAKALASGAKDAKAGSAKLNTGLGALSGGAATLSSGLGDAKAGSAALAGGLGAADTGAADLADGIAQILAGVQSLPTAITTDTGYQQLVGALAAVKAGIGTATDLTPATLLGGLNLMKLGVSNPACNPADPTNPANPCGAVEGLGAIKSQVTASVAPTTATLTALITAATTAGDLTVASGLASFAAALGAQTTTLIAGLTSVINGLTTQLLPGFDTVKLGLSNPACSLVNPSNPANPCGIKEVQGLVSAGIGQLVSAISTELSAALSQASAGADDLSAGVSQLAAGGAQLNGGLGQLADGGVRLADGAGQAAAGAGALTSGLGKIATGAGQLSNGLKTAADGSVKLSDGLEQARTGDTKIVGGAGQLRSQGTSKLVAGSNAATSGAAKKYAMLLALQGKVADGALPYGAPEGASGSAAYQLTLDGANTEGRDNTRRLLVAILLLTAASAVSWTIRRRATR